MNRATNTETLRNFDCDLLDLGERKSAIPTLKSSSREVDSKFPSGKLTPTIVLDPFEQSLL